MFDGEVLVVGLGSIGERHVRNLLAAGQREVTVVRRSDRAPRTVPSSSFRTVRTIEEGLSRGPAAVIVATPNALHVESLAPAVDRGVPTLVEVPLSHSLEGMADVRRQAEKTRTPVLMGHNLRFHPALAAIRRAVQSSAFGAIRYSRSQFGEFLPDCHRWEDFRLRYEARRDLGGGAILTSIHEIDHACWLFGPVEAVTCVARTRGLPIDVEDVAFLVLEHSTGVLSEVALDFVQRTYRRSLQIAGSEGTIEWNLVDDRVRAFQPDRGWGDLFSFADYDIARVINATYMDELVHFSAVASGRAQPINDLSQGMHVTDVALAALRSSREGRRIETDPALRDAFPTGTEGE